MGYDADSAITKAKLVVRHYGTANPWKLVKRLPSVDVIPADLGDNIMGFTLVSKRISIVTLNTQMDDDTATVVLGHEIGHSLLTRNTGTNYFYKNAGVAAVGSSEYIANCFMFQLMFGNRGMINPMNRNLILEQYGLPCWMSRYFELIETN